METIKFFKGVPPAPRPKYPFDKLEVGGGFFVKGGRKSLISSHRSYYQYKYKGRKFAVKEVKGGVRVWRIR